MSGRTSPRITPSTSSATRIAGKLNCTSAMRISTASTTPPKYPAMRPRATPSTAAKSIEQKPTASERREPYSIADSMSRPRLSVPRGKSQLPPLIQPGGLRASSTLTVARSYGLCGAMQGANAAPSRISRMTIALATVSGEWRKLWKMSLSHARPSTPRGTGDATDSIVSALRTGDTCQRALDAQSRINCVIQQVYDEIDDHEHECHQHEIRRHDRNVHE